MSLHHDGLIVSLALAVATALYLFAFRHPDIYAITPVTPLPIGIFGAADLVTAG